FHVTGVQTCALPISQADRPKNRHNQVRQRPRCGHPSHIPLGIPQAAPIHRYGLGPSKQQPAPTHQLGGKKKDERHHDRADRINMTNGIQSDATLLPGSWVAEHTGHVTMRSLVQCDTEKDRKRVDRNRLDEIRHWGPGQSSPTAARSPCPRLSTSGSVPVRSITVVAASEHAPPSMTAASSLP